MVEAEDLDVKEVTIHEGQEEFFKALHSRPPKRRVLGLGAPGGGKSLGILKIAQVLSAWRPMSIGGIVAPTRDRVDVVWGKFLEILEPLGWIQDIQKGAREIVLKNKTKIKFVAAKRSSEQIGSPIAGKDWHWAVEDEQQNIDDASLREVDARGRVTKHYRVFSSATNEPIHEFQMRVQAYDANPEYAVSRYSGYANCFTPLEHWEALKRNWSADDFDRIINCKDVPKEGRVYPEFSYSESACDLPRTLDITGALTQARYQTAYQWVIGFDPGILVSASVVLKAYQGTGRDERLWVVHDEVTTRDKTTEWHAQELLRWLRDHGASPNDAIVLMDPHENKESDRSDYLLMRQAGFQCFKSNGGQTIDRRHRISMMNALLKDATQRRRLKLLKGASGVPIANKLAEGLGHLMYRPNGEIEMHHKTAANLAHWPDAIGYGLYPFEHFRGGYTAGSTQFTSNKYGKRN